jgi:hypothetical protein
VCEGLLGWIFRSGFLVCVCAVGGMVARKQDGERSTANQNKMLIRGKSVKRALLNLNRQQKRVQGIEVLVAEDFADKRVVDIVIAKGELTVKRK